MNSFFRILEKTSSELICTGKKLLEMVKKWTFVSENNVETPSTIVVIPRPQDLEESGIKIGTTYI